MGKDQTLTRLIYLSLLLSFASQLHAKMDFPPELTSEKEIHAQALRLRAAVPEIVTSTSYSLGGASSTLKLEAYLKDEQRLVAQLKRDSRYMEMAEQRPPLQVWSFRSVMQITLKGNGANEEWRKFLHRFDVTNAPDQLRELLKDWPTASTQSFFSAWGGLLEKESREILRNPHLEEKWAMVVDQLRGLSMDELRTKFKAERFGVREKNWTWDDLDKLVAVMIHRENRISALMQHMNMARSNNGEAWFNAESLSDWHEFENLDPRVEKLLGSLKSRLIDRYGDPNADVTAEETVVEIILREVPPYLAIYRGCVGNDCSTERSWPFPYAPNERNFWIEDTHGRHIGYVSGAITELDGKPCLYIRDIRGPSLPTKYIPIIINGFYSIRSAYGADQMTIMGMTFVTQNADQLAQNELRIYGGNSIKYVNQTFPDREVRIRVLGNLTSYGLTYDSPDGQHADSVRQIFPSPAELASVRVKRVGGEMTIQDPNKDPDALWTLLQDAVGLDDVVALKRSIEQQINWREMLDVLQNKRKMPVQEYYAAIETQFETNKLPFSRNMMKKNQQLFLQGHLAAPDAFQGENLHQSARYVTDMLWRKKATPEKTEAVIRANVSALEESEVFIRNVHGLFERRQDDDVKRLDLLFKAGFRFTKINLSMDELQWMTSSLPQPEVNQWMINKVLKSTVNLNANEIEPAVADAIARLLINEDESVDEKLSLEAARMFYDIRGLVTRTALTAEEVSESLKSEENPLIRVPLAIAYLREIGLKGPLSIDTGIKLRKDLADKTVPSEMVREARQLIRSMKLPEEENQRNNADDCEGTLRRRPSQ